MKLALELFLYNQNDYDFFFQKLSSIKVGPNFINGILKSAAKKSITNEAAIAIILSNIKNITYKESDKSISLYYLHGRKPLNNIFVNINKDIYLLLKTIKTYEYTRDQTMHKFIEDIITPYLESKDSAADRTIDMPIGTFLFNEDKYNIKANIGDSNFIFNINNNTQDIYISKFVFIKTDILKKKININNMIFDSIIELHKDITIDKTTSQFFELCS